MTKQQGELLTGEDAVALEGERVDGVARPLRDRHGQGNPLGPSVAGLAIVRDDRRPDSGANETSIAVGLEDAISVLVEHLLTVMAVDARGMLAATSGRSHRTSPDSESCGKRPRGCQ